jgi:molybdopterin-binding protein
MKTKLNKLDRELRSSIAFIKNFLSCDKYSKMTIDTPEGTILAKVISEDSARDLVIEISRNLEKKATITYNHEENKWRRID